MIDAIRQLFRRRPVPRPASVPPGQRVYAVGDIHGRLDLFAPLIEAIERDDAARAAAETTIVLLGDLIDRGPDSAGVVAHARAVQTRRRVRILAGNHEEMFLCSFGRPDLLSHFLRAGGYETLLSYAVDRHALSGAGATEAQALMRAAVPEGDLAFIRAFEDRFTIGDYAFVHAGVRPGIPLDQQMLDDLRWIREPFLSSGVDHGQVVIHGHTIVRQPQFRANRIGIDTGAYMSGVLTALCLEGEERRLIQAMCGDDGAVTTVIDPA